MANLANNQEDLGAVTAYAIAVAHGYTGTEEQFAAQMTGAAASAVAADSSAEDAEAYAIGKRNGTDVTSTDPAYHNNAKYYSETLQVDDTLSVAGRAADAKAVGDELTDLRDDLEESIFSSDTNVPMTNVLTNSFPGYSVDAVTSNTLLTFHPMAQYNTYYLKFTEPCDVWFEEIPNASYIAIAKIDNAGSITEYTETSGAIVKRVEGTNSIRYRKSESNLPTYASKLHINAGTILAITIPSSLLASSVYVSFDYGTVVIDKTLFNNNIKLNKNQLSQVSNPNYVQYINNSGDDSSTERLDVYLRTFNGYILYKFVHTVSAGINSNVWRVSKAQFADEQFNVMLDITTTGEWECAIKLDGRSDFSGGVLHGDEIMTDISFFLDGKPVSLSALTSKTPFTNLSIVQESSLYDPNDSTTVFADHSSLHVFEDKLTIKQSLKFIVDCEMGVSYLAMFPIAKTCSGKYYTDQLYKYQDTAIPISQNDAREVTLFGNNITSTFALNKHTDVDNTTGKLMILDNSGNQYNKCYYTSCNVGTTVTEGTIWKSETEYKISR